MIWNIVGVALFGALFGGYLVALFGTIRTVKEWTAPRTDVTARIQQCASADTFRKMLDERDAMLRRELPSLIRNAQLKRHI